MSLTPNIFVNTPNPFGELFTWEWLTEFEKRTGIWTRTPELQAIAAMAQEEEVASWPLLAQVMQNQASHVDPTHVLVRKSGKPGRDLISGVGLSYFCIMVGDSGGGKSQIVSAARELVKPKHEGLPDGTGQGITKTFASSELIKKDADGNPLPKPVTKTTFNQHTVLINADEVKTLNAEIGREGSKTSSFMCTMWVGATAGTLAGERDRRVVLPANMYRLHATYGAQPQNCDSIMELFGDGFPQRFLWSFVEDCRAAIAAISAPAVPSAQLFPLPVWNPGSNPFGTSGGQLDYEFIEGESELPQPTWITWNSSPLMQKWITETRAARKAAREGINPGQETEEQLRIIRETGMASHMVLITIKTATLVAWIHGRCEPTDLDFEIACALMEVSKRWCAVVWKKLADAAAQVNVNVGTNRGQQKLAEQAYLDGEEARIKAEIVDWVYDKCLREGPQPYRTLRHGSDRKKKLIPVTLREEFGSNTPRIFIDDNGVHWAMVEGRPYDLRNPESRPEGW